MLPRLMYELGKLEGPAEENCAVTITDDLSTPGISVAVQRNVPVFFETGRAMQTDLGASSPVYNYRRHFKSESEEEIGEALQSLLNLPRLMS